MATILESSTITVDLANFASANPFSVEPGTTISTTSGDAIYGDRSTAWTLTNFGSVIARPENGDAAILFQAGGMVSNLGTASVIDGGDAGVEINGGVGEVTNEGTITGSEGFGVFLDRGGTVTNRGREATVIGSTIGVDIRHGTGTVTNSGTIGISGATVAGVDLEAGGTVVNQGAIRGGDGVSVGTAIGTVENEGRISGSGTGGVVFDAGGLVTNLGSDAEMIGWYSGVDITGGTGIVVNDGLVLATRGASEGGGTGIRLQAGGSVTNAASGYVGGTTGILAVGDTTVINAGTIAGTGGVAISFEGAANRLVLDPGASFIGDITASMTARNILELGVGSVPGTLAPVGGTFFQRLDSMAVDSAASWAVVGCQILDEGGLQNDGTINLISSTLAVASIEGVGELTINGDSELIVSGAVSAGETIRFVGIGGVVNFGDSADVHGTVVGYAKGDHVIDGADTIVNGGTVSASRIGIVLGGEGLLNNETSGSIIGGTDGVVITGAAGTIRNAGTIIGSTNLYVNSSNTGYSGIRLRNGGSIFNERTGRIDGRTGITVERGAGTVTNEGEISGSYSGVVLTAGGLVTNGLTGFIGDGRAYGIDISGAAGQVVNAGTVTKIGLNAGGLVSNETRGLIYSIMLAAGGGAVSNAGEIGYIGIRGGGSVTNESNGELGDLKSLSFETTVTNHGLIGEPGAGDVYCVDLLDGGTVINTGSIEGGVHEDSLRRETAVYLGGAGTVTNETAALVVARLGIILKSGGTVVDAGTIVGTGGTSIDFYAAGSLVLNAGAVLQGQVSGVSDADNTLELGAGMGTLANQGDFFRRLRTFSVDGGANWTLSGMTMTDLGGLDNDGTLNLSGSVLSITSLSGAGTVTIDGGSTLIVGGSVSNDETITFAGIGGVLRLGDPATVLATIDGYQPSDTIADGGETVVNAGTIAGTGIAGVLLGPGGTLTNGTRGSITGAIYGVLMAGGPGTIANRGKIGSGSLYGIEFEDGGTISNAASAVISGTCGILAESAAAFITNAGVIMSGAVSAGAFGIDLDAGGSVTNTATGMISAWDAAVVVEGGPGNVTNAGRMTASGFEAILLSAGGTIINQKGGTIVGPEGIVVQNAAGSIVNAGSIEAGSPYTRPIAVALDDGGSVTNLASGVIGSVTAGGVYIAGGSGTVTNDGFIGGSMGEDDGIDSIRLTDGGVVTNEAAGHIQGAIVIDGGFGSVINWGTADRVVLGGAGTIENAGTIGFLKNGASVYLYGGGELTNKSNATIIGGVKSTAGFVINAGIVSNSNGFSLMMDDGGVVDNEKGGRLESNYASSVYFTNQSGTVINAGAITATNTFGTIYGIGLAHGGLVTNLAGGTITGRDGGILSLLAAATITNAGIIAATGTAGIGIEFGAPAGVAGNLYDNTIVNSGTISGGESGMAIRFGAGNDRLVLDPGAVFVGEVDGGKGENTLDLDKGSGAGTLAGLGTRIVDFETVTVATGAEWILTGASKLAPGDRLVNDGTLVVQADSLVTIGGLVSGSGIFSILARATLEVSGTVEADQKVEFAASTGTLTVTDPSYFRAGIGGLVKGDRIDIATSAFAYSRTETLGFSENAAGTGGTLTLVDGADKLRLTLFGQYVAADFRLAADGLGGTLVTVTASAAGPVQLVTGHG